MTLPPRIEAVVFDLDGLLVNTEDLYLEAGDQVLGRRGKTHDAVLREQMTGRPARDALQIMIDYHGLPDTVDVLAAETAQVLRRLLDTSLEVMPGLPRFLEDIHAAELVAAVATSATCRFADDVLARVGLGHRFRFVLSAEDVPHGKPAPDIYLLAAERLGLSPERMMVLEDSGNGCRAALAAGAVTVAVPNRHTRGHAFAGVPLVADTLDDPRIRQMLGIGGY
jgi:pseudouridine-5'-monophosphatase